MAMSNGPISESYVKRAMMHSKCPPLHMKANNQHIAGRCAWRHRSRQTPNSFKRRTKYGELKIENRLKSVPALSKHVTRIRFCITPPRLANEERERERERAYSA